MVRYISWHGISQREDMMASLFSLVAQEKEWFMGTFLMLGLELQLRDFNLFHQYDFMGF